jgi:hypothetical protein
MLVPVFPIVIAGEFFVFVGDAKSGEVPVKLPIVVEQEVFGSAVDAERRKSVGAVLGIAYQIGSKLNEVVSAAFFYLPEHAYEFSFPLASVAWGGEIPSHTDRSGVGYGGFEKVRALEGESQCSVSTHGKPCGGKLSIDMIRMAEQRGQFVGERLEVLVAMVGVYVEPATAVGHDDHERFTFDIPLN